MCGIAGVISLSNDSVLLKKDIDQIIADQHHRGPDYNRVDSYLTHNCLVILGHNRLSIVDLSENSHQPFSDSGNNYTIVFNGEIYNYQAIKAELTSLNVSFRTNGDTEVLLEAYKAWGNAAFEKFNGMFAFAIYDKQKSTLTIVRDRFGVKPLYYLLTKNCFYFASSGRVLARQNNLRPNFDFLSRGLKYFAFDDDSGDSQYEGLKTLQPGKFITISIQSDKLTLEEQLYYSFQDKYEALIHELAIIPEQAIYERVAELLSDAVNIRTSSEVPFAISLSGGLDSSALAALLSKNNTNTTGFTFGSPVFDKSEGPLVANLASKLEMKVNYCWPSSDEIINAYQKTLDAQDAPFANTSIIAQNLVYRSAANAGVKVLIGGQGGDEILMGYHKYQFFYLKHLLKTNKVIDFASFLYYMLPIFWAERSRFSTYLNGCQRYLSKNGRSSSISLPSNKSIIDFGFSTDLRFRQLVDIFKSSLMTLLRYEDRNSMSHSIESRLPFLDYRLVEMAVALPISLKLRNGYGKWILREIMKNKIPDDIRLARYKRGFDVSQNWFKKGLLGDHIRTQLNDNYNKIKDFLPRNKTINNLYSDDNLNNNNFFIEAVSLKWLSERC